MDCGEFPGGLTLGQDREPRHAAPDAVGHGSELLTDGVQVFDRRLLDRHRRRRPARFLGRPSTRGGNLGHLSNDQSVDLLRQIDTGSLNCLIAGHISEKNNRSSIVDQLIRQLENVPVPVLADQEAGFGWISI